MGIPSFRRTAPTKVAATNNIFWICISSLILTILLLIAGVLGAIRISDKAFDKAFQAGRADAVNEEILLKQRDEFTKTDAFKLAFKYDKLNNKVLMEILQCDRPGWKIKEKNGKSRCFPYSSKEKNLETGEKNHIFIHEKCLLFIKKLYRNLFL